MPTGYRDLKVWRKSIDFAESVYLLSAEFPASERFGVTSQIRRASVSVAANIAEGAERHGEREFLHFLGIASGSLAETSTFLILAQRLGFAEPEKVRQVQAQGDEIGRMLSGLKRSLRQGMARRSRVSR